MFCLHLPLSDLKGFVSISHCLIGNVCLPLLCVWPVRYVSPFPTVWPEKLCLPHLPVSDLIDFASLFFSLSDLKRYVFQISHCLAWNNMPPSFPYVPHETFRLPVLLVSDLKGLSPLSPTVWSEFSQCLIWKVCLPLLPLSDPSSLSVWPETFVSPFSHCLIWVLSVSYLKGSSPPSPTVWSEFSQCLIWKVCLPLLPLSDLSSLSVWSERFVSPFSHCLIWVLSVSDLKGSVHPSPTVWSEFSQCLIWKVLSTPLPLSDLKRFSNVWAERFRLPNLPVTGLKGFVSLLSHATVLDLKCSVFPISQCLTWKSCLHPSFSVWSESLVSTLPSVSDLKVLSPPFPQGLTWKSCLPHFPVSDLKSCLPYFPVCLIWKSCLPPVSDFSSSPSVWPA